MDKEKFLKPKEASLLLRFTTRTLLNWDEQGLIKSIRTVNNQRRYILSSFPDYKQFKPEENRRKICYCRVSTTSQKEDMQRQVDFFKINYPSYEIIRDIGSGLNFKRKGFNSILESAVKGNVQEIVVTHKDRLCRFGFEMFENILKMSDGIIVVLDHQKTSPEKELVDDLVSIVTVFSSRLYGLRSHSIKNKIKESVASVENHEVQIISNPKRKRKVTIDV